MSFICEQSLERKDIELLADGFFAEGGDLEDLVELRDIECYCGEDE